MMVPRRRWQADDREEAKRGGRRPAGHGGLEDRRRLPGGLREPDGPLARLPGQRAPPPRGRHAAPVRQQLPRPHRRPGQPPGPAPGQGADAAGHPAARPKRTRPKPIKEAVAAGWETEARVAAEHLPYIEHWDTMSFEVLRARRTGRWSGPFTEMLSRSANVHSMHGGRARRRQRAGGSQL